MKRTPGLFLVAALVAAPLTLAYLGEQIAVESCLDSGGSYDYDAGRCDHHSNHVFIPFGERRRALLLGTGAAMVAVGAGATLRARRGARRRPSPPAGA